MGGLARYLQDQGADLDPVQGWIETLQDAGNTVVTAALEARLKGLLAIADALKGDAKAAMDRLKGAGIEPMMLTGDNERTARAVARAVGIEHFRARFFPRRRPQEIRRLQEGGVRVMMVGDNDAPAPTQADVGVAIGISAYRKTSQNIGLAFAFNGVGIPRAIAGVGWPPHGPGWL